MSEQINPVSNTNAAPTGWEALHDMPTTPNTGQETPDHAAQAEADQNEVKSTATTDNESQTSTPHDALRLKRGKALRNATMGVWWKNAPEAEKRKIEADLRQALLTVMESPRDHDGDGVQEEFPDDNRNYADMPGDDLASFLLGLEEAQEVSPGPDSPELTEELAPYVTSEPINNENSQNSAHEASQATPDWLNRWQQKQ